MRRAQGISLLYTAIALLVAVALPVGAHPARRVSSLVLAISTSFPAQMQRYSAGHGAVNRFDSGTTGVSTIESGLFVLLPNVGGWASAEVGGTSPQKETPW